MSQVSRSTIGTGQWSRMTTQSASIVPQWLAVLIVRRPPVIPPLREPTTLELVILATADMVEAVVADVGRDASRMSVTA